MSSIQMKIVVPMKISMSHKQAAIKIKHWYLIQMHMLEIAVKGDEQFTLFEKLPRDQRTRILKWISLNPSEIPVLILTISPDQYIINTTERFIKFSLTNEESLYYREFYDFENFTSLYYRKKKHNRHISPSESTELWLKKLSGEIVFWKVPAGNVAYYFWNITRMVSMIRIEENPPKIIAV